MRVAPLARARKVIGVPSSSRAALRETAVSLRSENKPITPRRQLKRSCQAPEQVRFSSKSRIMRMAYVASLEFQFATRLLTETILRIRISAQSPAQSPKRVGKALSVMCDGRRVVAHAPAACAAPKACRLLITRSSSSRRGPRACAHRSPSRRRACHSTRGLRCRGAPTSHSGSPCPQTP